MAAVKNYREEDLFPFLKEFWEAQGYQVDGEVGSCDLVATKEDDLVLVELKKNFSIELLLQGVQRQTIHHQVYLAIPRPKTLHGEHYRGMVRLCKRLGLGLLLVSIHSPSPQVYLVLSAQNHNTTTVAGHKRKARLKKEISARSCHQQKGGVTQQKISTAYREQAIQILVALEQCQNSSPSKLRKEFDCCDKTGSILRDNYYNWFIKISRGNYAISPVGLQFLEQGEFRDLLKYYRKKIKTASPLFSADS